MPHQLNVRDEFLKLIGRLRPTLMKPHILMILPIFAIPMQHPRSVLILLSTGSKVMVACHKAFYRTAPMPR